MTEFPTPKPTTPVNWSDSGTRTEPGVAKRDAGWAFNEKPPFDFFNAIQGNFGDHVQYLEGTVLRGFESVKEGIDATFPGEMFRTINILPRTPHQGDVTRTFLGGDSGYLLCTDGSRIYVASIVDSELRAYTVDEPTEALVEEWSVALAMPSPERIKTDGAIVIVAGNDAGGDDVIIFDAATGASLFSKAVTGAPVVACEPDSDFDATGGNPRAFWAEANFIFTWDSVGGATSWAGAASDILAMCTTPDYVLTVEDTGVPGTTGVSVWARRKNDLTATPIASFPEHPQGRPAAICSDGESCWVALYFTSTVKAPVLTRLPVSSTLVAQGYNYRAGMPFWSTDLPELATVTSTALTRIEVDDRYVYVKGGDLEMYILNKHTGGIVWAVLGDVLSFAIDGTWIYRTDATTPTALRTLGTTRQAGLWLRAGDGASSPEDDLFGSRRKPFKKLALPVR